MSNSNTSDTAIKIPSPSRSNSLVLSLTEARKLNRVVCGLIMAYYHQMIKPEEKPYRSDAAFVAAFCQEMGYSVYTGQKYWPIARDIIRRIKRRTSDILYFAFPTDDLFIHAFYDLNKLSDLI